MSESPPPAASLLRNREDQERDRQPEGSSSPTSNKNNSSDDQDQDDEESTASSPVKQKDSKANQEDDDDEDDDDEDEDDEDEEEEEDQRPGRNKSRKRRKAGVNRFIEDMADVDDDDEQMDDDEEDLVGEDGFIDQSLPDEGDSSARRTAAQNQHLDRMRRQEDDRSAEAIAEELRQRYKRSTRYGAQSDYAQVPQRMLMPSVEDPNLWSVPVKPGREAEIVMTLLRKSFSRSATSKPLGFISAFFRDSIPGRIYIEARRVEDAIQACADVVGTYARQSTSLKLIPIEEMADLLRIEKVVKNIPIGGWVRIKRGKNAGDLAKVLDKSDNGVEIGVQFIPRIDLTPKDNTLMTDSMGRKRKKGAAGSAAIAFRPQQKFFNAEEVRKAFGRPAVKESQGEPGVYLYGGEEYRDGYCQKDIRVTGLITEDVNPTLEEITKFSGGDSSANGIAGGMGGEDTLSKANGLDLHLLAEASRKKQNLILQPGDHVEVFEGEQKGVTGSVYSISGDTVTIDIQHEELLGQRIETQINQVRKKFKPGDHIKVTNGKHLDETGLVLKIEDQIITFLSDLSFSEVEVFSKDIREAIEVGSGVNVIGGYELHNLVMLDAQTAGVIFKIERESFRVLDQNGNAISVRPNQISMKKDSVRAVALDRDGDEIRTGDMVKEVQGELRQGQVLHLYQSSIAFLHNRDFHENNGVFLARTRHLAPLAPKTSSTSDLSKMNPALAARGAVAAGGANSFNKRGGRDMLAGKNVAVVKGQYKTHRGIIKDTQGNMARVEMHTTGRILSLPIDILIEKDPHTGRTSKLMGNAGPRPGGNSGFGGASQSSNPYSQPSQPFGMPAAGSRTPAYGTFGNKTPSYNPSYGGNKTPAYNPYGDGSKTPAYNPYGDGSKTPAYNPYGGDGGKTPAYNPYGDGGKTPAYAGGDGGKTPAYNPYGDGSRTPAQNPYGGAARNPRENPYAAATPGAYGAAPTPGASTHTPYGGSTSYTPAAAYTPAATLSGATAPTPAMGAPTPAGAATPWGGAPPPNRSSYSNSTTSKAPLVENIQVRIVKDRISNTTFQNGLHLNLTGQVLTVSPNGNCTVKVSTPTGNVVVREVPSVYLEPMPPSRRGDAFVVLGGEKRGEKFKVGAIDGDEYMGISDDGSRDSFFSRSNIAVIV